MKIRLTDEASGTEFVEVTLTLEQFTQAITSLLEPIEGPYCVYAAWKEWVEAWNEKQSENMQLDLDSIDKTVLFSAFHAATGKHQPEPVEVA